ncbi:hypothetical protein BaRGS_00009367 [Batillaria attramentaria]|uniref:Uncharacterized protein n=1 Tax=Batillaria attramentaria TaxID=370345 RepID=A0ABD0LK78_9CAEN
MCVCVLGRGGTDVNNSVTDCNQSHEAVTHYDIAIDPGVHKVWKHPRKSKRESKMENRNHDTRLPERSRRRVIHTAEMPHPVVQIEPLACLRNGKEGKHQSSYVRAISGVT